MQLLRHNRSRYIAGACAMMILMATYMLQQFDYSAWVQISSLNGKFIFNKSIRFLLNDFACLLLVTAIFNKSDYLRISFWIFLVELLFFLPLYFVLKLSLEGDSEISSPLLSQLHRMIINPLLMLILIMGFLYQDHFWKKNKS